MHKLFQQPLITKRLTHESFRGLGPGGSGDPMTFQTQFIATLDHVGTHVDASHNVGPNGASIDEMPLDLITGEAACFDLRHLPDLGDTSEDDMAGPERAFTIIDR